MPMIIEKTNKPKANRDIVTMGCLKPERKIQDNYLVYGVGGVCPTIRARDYKDPKKIVVKVGNVVGAGKSQGGSVYMAKGISPTLIAGMDHGNTVPYIIDDTYPSRPPRLYKDIAPTQRGQRVMDVIVYDDYNHHIRADQQTVGSVTTQCGGSLRKWFKVIERRE